MRQRRTLQELRNIKPTDEKVRCTDAWRPVGIMMRPGIYDASLRRFEKYGVEIEPVPQPLGPYGRKLVHKPISLASESDEVVENEFVWDPAVIDDPGDPANLI